MFVVVGVACNFARRDRTLARPIFVFPLRVSHAHPFLSCDPVVDRWSSGAFLIVADVVVDVVVDLVCDWLVYDDAIKRDPSFFRLVSFKMSDSRRRNT